jgi:hypothetical protein
VLTDLALAAGATQPVTGTVEWRTFGGEGDNTAIVAFAAQPLRNGGHQLYARVANYGSTAVARTLAIDLDGTQLTSEPVRLGPGAEAEWSWPLPPSASRVTARLSDADVQPLDDQAVAVLDGSTTKHVLLVSDSSIALERALRAQPGFDIQAVAPANYQSRDDIDVYIFVGYVPPTLPTTPALIVAPPADQSLVAVAGQQFGLKADQVNDGRFAVLDWRPLMFRRTTHVHVPAWAEVAVASGDTPLVLVGQRDGQPITIWTFDPQDTNLLNRIQFPLLASTTLQTLLPDTNNGFSVGMRAPVALEVGNGSSIAVGQRVTQPGVYGTATGAVAVNALDADEARFGARPAPQIVTVAPAVTDAEAQGRELWQPLVTGALLVLTAEWLYINRRRLPRNQGARRRMDTSKS